jgi:signal transduction histidine kinase
VPQESPKWLDFLNARANRDVRRRQLLLIDDSAELLSSVSTVLVQSGYDVRTASDPEQVFTTLESFTPDLVLCDVMMPQKDGFELFQEIRSRAEFCELPFVFLTTLSAREHVLRGKAMGCDDFLLKPFDIQELLAVVSGKIYSKDQRSRLKTVELEGYRKRIIQTLSHEFRTPLVSVNTAAELLLDRKEAMLDERSKKLIESIYRGGQRLERLVQDFMTMQQIELGHAAASYSQFHAPILIEELLNGCIDGFLDALPLGCEKTQIEVHFVSEAARDTLIDVYEMQMYSVFQHLFGNAVKFGGSDQPVQIAVDIEGRDLIVDIRDFGPGMSDSQINQVAKPFVQLNREQLEQQGAGLGLTIAKYLIDINRGKLSLMKPESGNGLVVRLRFLVVAQPL